MTSLKEYNSAEHALQYLARADRIPYRAAGEAVVMELVPRSVRRILDLGAGDGRLLALLRLDRPEARGVPAAASPTLLDAGRARCGGDALVEGVAHGGAGAFDAVVSCFAIHHCSHARKRALYAEAFALLEPGGVFYNLEHVASPTSELHEAFFVAMGMTLADEDQSNQLLDVETQVGWLRAIGFAQVDCFWKWRELAVFGGVKQ